MIDSQHKELIGKINAVMESCEQSNDKAVAVRTLDYLEDYTNFHFSAEEQLQREIDYPGFQKHKEQHDIFRQTIADLQEMLQEEEGPPRLRRKGAGEGHRMAVCAHPGL